MGGSYRARTRHPVVVDANHRYERIHDRYRSWSRPVRTPDSRYLHHRCTGHAGRRCRTLARVVIPGWPTADSSGLSQDQSAATSQSSPKPRLGAGPLGELVRVVTQQPHERLDLVETRPRPDDVPLPVPVDDAVVREPREVDISQPEEYRPLVVDRGGEVVRELDRAPSVLRRELGEQSAAVRRRETLQGPVERAWLDGVVHTHIERTEQDRSWPVRVNVSLAGGDGPVTRTPRMRGGEPRCQHSTARAQRPTTANGFRRRTATGPRTSTHRSPSPAGPARRDVPSMPAGSPGCRPNAYLATG